MDQNRIQDYFNRHKTQKVFISNGFEPLNSGGVVFSNTDFIRTSPLYPCQDPLCSFSCNVGHSFAFFVVVVECGKR